MKRLFVSSDFSISDIHKIREFNYNHTKNMSMEEKIAYYNNSGKGAEQEIKRMRMAKRKG